MFNFSKTGADVKCAQAYDGYTPSKKARTFDEAIKSAPVRQEWIEEHPTGHALTAMTLRDVVDGLAFLLFMVGLMFFVLSR